MLGKEPSGVLFRVHHKLVEQNWTSAGYIPQVLYPSRPFKAVGMGYTPIPFGDGLRGDFYYPLDAAGKPAAGKWPVVCSSALTLETPVAFNDFPAALQRRTFDCFPRCVESRESLR